MRTLISIQRGLRRVSFVARPLDLFQQCLGAVHQKGGMSLAGRSEICFHAQMKLNLFGLKPCTAAFGELRWFWSLRKSEKVYIELARPGFFAGWHGELHMINGKNLHGSIGYPASIQ